MRWLCSGTRHDAACSDPCVRQSAVGGGDTAADYIVHAMVCVPDAATAHYSTLVAAPSPAAAAAADKGVNTSLTWSYVPTSDVCGGQ
jgi:hypothetical protein